MLTNLFIYLFIYLSINHEEKPPLKHSRAPDLKVEVKVELIHDFA